MELNWIEIKTFIFYSISTLICVIMWRSRIVGRTVRHSPIHWEWRRREEKTLLEILLIKS